MFAERQLLRWLPSAGPLGLSGLTHLLHAQDAAAVAAGLVAFLARHLCPGSHSLMSPEDARSPCR
jgi:hypothetical protein